MKANRTVLSHMKYLYFIREAEITEYMQTEHASDSETHVPAGRVFEKEADYLAEFHIN